jgi:NO-binding membrane sensor protein with MHYT domain
VVLGGVRVVGFRGAGPLPLLFAGAVTGVGVAPMRCLGMAALRLDGSFGYDAALVGLSVVIAVLAATAAPWAAVTVRGFLATLGASPVMALGVTGMHYVGMAALGVQLHEDAGHVATGQTPTSLAFPMLIAPVIFLPFATINVMFGPVLLLGDDEKTPARAEPRERAQAGR